MINGGSNTDLMLLLVNAWSYAVIYFGTQPIGLPRVCKCGGLRHMHDKSQCQWLGSQMLETPMIASLFVHGL